MRRRDRLWRQRGSPGGARGRRRRRRGRHGWLWSRDELEGAVDVLFVDEAAQFSLANALAVAPAASSLVLLGDPQQLEQPIQGSHPPGAERSALGHVLGDRPVMPEGAGLFLDRTWRLHPDICGYTSEVFYASQLQPIPELARQELRGIPPADGTGLRWHPVGHEGNAIESIEEADVIVSLVRDLLAISPTWTTRTGEVKPVTLEDIVIVAPYNAHVELIGERLAAAGFGRRAGRDGRQVPGPGGRRLDLLDGQLHGRGGAAGHGVPLLAQPAERGDVARPLRRDRRRVTGARPGLVPQPAPDAARERAVPAGRGGSRAGGADPGARRRGRGGGRS